MRPGSATIWGFELRLAAFYAALFILPGIQMPFFPVWLKARGLDPGMIGIVLAVPMVARVLAIPIVTRVADRRDALRTALVLTCLASFAGYTLVGLSAAAVAILIAYTLTSLASTPVMPLAETYALKGLSARGRAYGPVRLWGSLAYIVGNFAAGFAADAMPASDLIWLMVTAAFLLALAALSLPSPASRSPHAPAARSATVLRDRAFVAVLAAASLIQASHAFFYGFSSVQWHAAGLDGAVIAALWALGVAAEIVLFALQARLPPFFEPTVLLMFGAAGAVVRWLAMALDPPLVVLPLLQLLHALSFGATHLGTLMFFVRHAPPGQAATAQGYLAITLGLAMAGATALSGLLYEDFGGRAYAVMALTAFAGGACGFVAHRMRGESSR